MNFIFWEFSNSRDVLRIKNPATTKNATQIIVIAMYEKNVVMAIMAGSDVGARRSQEMMKNVGRKNVPNTDRYFLNSKPSSRVSLNFLKK